MLLKITNYCSMNCSHCISNSNKNGEHMTFNELVLAMRAVTELRPRLLIVSGGEPSEHPDFLEFLGYIRTNYQGVLIVTTNGQFLGDYEYSKALFETFGNVIFQVTNDSRYYPKKIDEGNLKELQCNFKNVHFFKELGSPYLYPQGRALRYELDDVKFTTPKCFNIRSVTRSYNSVSAAIRMLEGREKVCTPSVDREGLKLGESHLCPSLIPLGGINHSTATNAVIASKCDDCGLCKNLSPLHMNAIGMLSQRS